ncbi:DEAD/DEAH box helicase [Vibrio splendidus]
MNQDTQSEILSVLNQLPSSLGGVVEQSLLAVACDAYTSTGKPHLLVLPTEEAAESAVSQLIYIGGLNEDQVVYLPGGETLPYDDQNASIEQVARRGRVFRHILSQDVPAHILVVSSYTYLQYFASKSHWVDSVERINVGDVYSANDVASLLQDRTYVSQSFEVTQAGQYFVNHNVIDVFTADLDLPVRVKIVDGIVNSIDTFHPNTKSTQSSLAFFYVAPVTEFPFNDESIQRFREQYRTAFKVGLKDPIYRSVISKEFCNGLDSLMPFFAKSVTHLSQLDYRLIVHKNTCSVMAHHFSFINQRYEELANDPTSHAIEPFKLWMLTDSMISVLKRPDTLIVQSASIDGVTDVPYLDNGISRMHNMSELIASLKSASSLVDKTVVFHQGHVRKEHLKKISLLMGKKPQLANSWLEINELPPGLVIAQGPLLKGYFDFSQSERRLFVSESEIFGHQLLEDDLNELNGSLDDYEDIKDLVSGDLVVHVNHGIGVFDGLEALKHQGGLKDYFTVKFANEQKIYVPLDQLSLITPYSALDPEKVVITDSDRAKWDKTLQEAFRNIAQKAVALNHIKQIRNDSIGIGFDSPDNRYVRFCQLFPFPPTRDQLRSSSEITEDLCSPRPMSRLLEGDVGFGKTEIAMRACFLAYQSNYLSVVLAPSKILADQHFDSFVERFRQFPDVTIVKVTGKNDAATRKTLSLIAEGKVDIVIGTHRVLKDDVDLQTPGLVVVDEEHRFGQADKKRLSHRFEGINQLSMTATPIPGTLSLSLHGILETSTLRTPPAKRLPVRTILAEHSDSKVKEAIEREALRNGQVYLLHNNVSTIESRALDLSKEFSHLNVGFVHGKMSDKQIEDVMLSFHRHEIDILVSTTVIEIGVDVPNANTIIIENADMFGVATLHQLRGRVGRAKRQGYAYLLASETTSQTGTARLMSVAEASGLGQGFKLADRDMEIRGAGEILQDEQSGQIANIGYNLYFRLLSRMLQVLEDDPSHSWANSTAASYLNDGRFSKYDLGYGLLIPDTYIENTMLRLSFYRKLTITNTESEFNAVIAHMIDRFGPVPFSLEVLLNVYSLNFKLQELGISRCSIGFDREYSRTGRRRLISETTQLVISTNSSFDSAATEAFLSARLENDNSLVIDEPGDTLDERLSTLETALKFHQDL